MATAAGKPRPPPRPPPPPWAPPRPHHPTEAGSRKKIYYLPRPALSQTVICVASRGLPESDPHYHLLRMVTSRAPASAGGWLRGMEQVTYGVRGIDEANSQTGLYGSYVSV